MKVIKKSVQSGAKIKVMRARITMYRQNEKEKRKNQETNASIIERDALSKWQPSKLICSHEMCQFENHLRLSRQMISKVTLILILKIPPSPPPLQESKRMHNGFCLVERGSCCSLSVIRRSETELTKLLHLPLRRQHCCKWTATITVLFCSQHTIIIVNFISFSLSLVFDLRDLYALILMEAYFVLQQWK